MNSTAIISDSQHLQGRIKLCIDWLGDDLRGHVPISDEAGKHDAFAQVVWKMEDDERSPGCEATAKRLVACWNACEGIADPENAVARMRVANEKIPMWEATVYERNHLAHQRDVLFKALDRIATSCDIDTLRAAIDCAKEAISAADRSGT